MLSQKALHELKEIIAQDYGAAISDDQAKELGTTLLRLTRVGLSALARANAQKALAAAREEHSLGAKTNT